jgi:signal transduction histidine kinase
LSPEKSADYLEEISAGGTRLLELINDILEITQMDAQEADTNAPVAVTDIISVVVASMRPAAEKAGVVIRNTAPASLPSLRGNSKRVQRALLHLLSNSVKFTERGGWARISARAESGGLAIEVSDNGVGLPPDSEAQIVALFSQCDGSLSRKHEGVGLGLTFVRRVADQHGASLHISSKLGEGTTVRLVFPADRILSVAEVA